jgi:hypothetical protein
MNIPATKQGPLNGNGGFREKKKALTILFAFQQFVDNNLRNIKVTPSTGGPMYNAFPPISLFPNVFSCVK